MDFECCFDIYFKITYIIQRRAICDSYKNITVYLYDESSSITHSAAATIILLSDTTIGMKAEFNNLPEDRKYLASASVYYSEQIAQHSTQLITSEHCRITSIIAIIIAILISGTFDIMDVNYTIQTEAIHLTVHYVEGSESPNRFYAELKCVSITIHKVFHGSNGIINTNIISPNELCNLLVTDADAMSFSSTIAAVTFENITVLIHMGSTTNTALTSGSFRLLATLSATPTG